LPAIGNLAKNSSKEEDKEVRDQSLFPLSLFSRRGGGEGGVSRKLSVQELPAEKTTCGVRERRKRKQLGKKVYNAEETVQQTVM